MSEDGTSEKDTTDLEHPPQLLADNEGSQRLTLADALQLGVNIEYIRRYGSDLISESPSVEEVVEILHQMEELLDSRDLNTVVTDQLSRYSTKLTDRYSSGGEISPDDIKDLEKRATTWLHLLNQELEREERIPASDTGMLDVDRLANAPERLFSPAVWDWLDERPKSDVQEACKTVIIGCPTSSVMLSLRAVEHCLRKWYEDENESLEAGWGHVLDQLMEENVEDEKKNDTVLTQLSDLPPVLSNLYYLKEKRNEVNHPDKSPSSQEARRTLMIVASTISEIHSEMQREAVQEAEEEGVNLDEWTQAQIKTEDMGLEGVIKTAIVSINERKDGKGAPRSTIYGLAEYLGLSKNEVDDVLRELLMNGEIYEPDEDHIKPI